MRVSTTSKSFVAEHFNLFIDQYSDGHQTIVLAPKTNFVYSPVTTEELRDLATFINSCVENNE